MAILTSVQYPTLKTELVTDPKTLGLPGMDAATAAAKLNEAGASAETKMLETVLPAYKILGATIQAEFDALSATEKQRYSIIISAGLVDVSNTNIRAAFQTMFAGGTTTRANLIALVNRPISRAVALFNIVDLVVFEHDVLRARALP